MDDPGSGGQSHLIDLAVVGWLFDRYEILIGAVLVAAGLYFSAVAYALRDFSRVKLEAMLVRNNGRKRYEAFIDAAAKLTVTSSILRMMANLLLILVIADACLVSGTDGDRRLVGLLEAFGFSAVLVLVFSVAVAGAWAKYGGEALLARSAGFLRVCQWSIGWLTSVLGLFDELVRRLAGVHRDPESQSEEVERDILDAVSEGEEQGVVDEHEKEMIESVIEFQDTHAGQIMTPRTETIGIRASASLDEVRDLIAREGHSRLPVYEETIDDVIGVLYAKDLLQHLGNQKPFDVPSLMRQAVFVPETKPLRDLLREFQQKKVHIAIILDEYGGMAGVVTIEDILEELVGEIADEYEPAEPEPITRLDEYTAEIDARMRVADLNDELDVELPEDADYDTLGGFVFSTMGKIPARGEWFVFGSARFEVLDAEPRRVNRVKLSITPNGAKEEDG